LTFEPIPFILKTQTTTADSISKQNKGTSVFGDDGKYPHIPILHAHAARTW